MNPCGATTGFFVLGRCDRPAVTACRCGRPVCAEHVDAQGLCPECSGVQGYADPYRPGWARGYRRAHYQRTSYDYGDPVLYDTYDGYDREGFDQGGDSGDSGDDFDIGGDLGDGSGDGGWDDS
ncbi:hypothetical protein OG417_30500 [Actinoallomurus sp. NBC_01490]|uniref:hypothetical protein n=1 Tax=Actinoallomurus sp. NBC_01490 TaxID=2903557 RepID=UPI002E334AB1|nr:hypothetical protein [Actinoallomurus sp. NBC_01490]